MGVGQPEYFGPTGPFPPGGSAPYYRTGYFGNEAPFLSRQFRFCKVVADKAAQWAFTVNAYLVDDEQYTVKSPLELSLGAAAQHLSINRVGHRVSLKVFWPAAPANQNVIELSIAFIPLTEK